VALSCVYDETGATFKNTVIDATSSFTNTQCTSSEESLNITVSFPIYVIALASWLGWWLLILFCGAGLSALPVDLINEFRFRPTPMKEDDFARAKAELAKQVDKLLQIGKQLLEDRMKADKAGGCKQLRIH
jgi:LMBR1 domain-containing protein 1